MDGELETKNLSPNEGKQIRQDWKSKNQIDNELATNESGRGRQSKQAGRKTKGGRVKQDKTHEDRVQIKQGLN